MDVCTVCTVHMNAMLYKVLYACLYINTYIHTYKQINPSVDAKKLLDLVRRKLEGMYVCIVMLWYHFLRDITFIYLLINSYLRALQKCAGPRLCWVRFSLCRKIERNLRRNRYGQ